MKILPPLLIPYADLRDGDGSISCEALSDLSEYEIAKMRDDATLANRRGKRPVYACPECRGPLYPRGDSTGRRPHWSHFGKDRPPCPYDKPRLTPDAVSAIVFRGRQEGDSHRNLRVLLYNLACADPDTEVGSCKTDQYDRPEEGTGCYPDVTFIHAGKKRVLEVQLARISLATIATRRDHYERQGADLIWITRNFDGEAFKRMFHWDIIAAQSGVVYSIDDEVLTLIATDNSLRLRRFVFDPGLHTWASSIVSLKELVVETAPPPSTEPAAERLEWHERFKAQWIALAAIPESGAIQEHLIPRLLTKLRTDPGGLPPGLTTYSIESVLSTLLSIERARPIGIYKGNIAHMINYRSVHLCGGRCVALFNLALRRLQPTLLEKPSIKAHLRRAKKKCEEEGTPPFTRESLLGRIWLLLWPDQPYG